MIPVAVREVLVATEELGARTCSAEGESCGFTQIPLFPRNSSMATPYEGRKFDFVADFGL